LPECPGKSPRYATCHRAAAEFFETRWADAFRPSERLAALQASLTVACRHGAGVDAGAGSSSGSPSGNLAHSSADCRSYSARRNRSSAAVCNCVASCSSSALATAFNMRSSCTVGVRSTSGGNASGLLDRAIVLTGMCHVVLPLWQDHKNRQNSAIWMDMIVAAGILPLRVELCGRIIVVRVVCAMLYKDRFRTRARCSSHQHDGLCYSVGISSALGD
jgi:hypothetical protein